MDATAPVKVKCCNWCANYATFPNRFCSHACEMRWYKWRTATKKIAEAEKMLAEGRQMMAEAMRK